MKFYILLMILLSQGAIAQIRLPTNDLIEQISVKDFIEFLHTGGDTSGGYIPWVRTAPRANSPSYRPSPSNTPGDATTSVDSTLSGYIVNCEEKIELLDFFEAKQTIKSFMLDDLVGYSGDNIFEKAKHGVRKIQSISPEIASELENIISDFQTNNMALVDRGVILTINNSVEVMSSSKQCYKKQIAVQLKSPLSRQFRLLVDKDIWSTLDDETKIGFLIHEAILKIALGKDHKNANKTRVLNSFLNMKNVEESDLISVFNWTELE